MEYKTGDISDARVGHEASSSRPRFRHCPCSIRYKCVFVRTYSFLPAIAGVAMQPSCEPGPSTGHSNSTGTVTPRAVVTFIAVFGRDRNFVAFRLIRGLVNWTAD